MSKWPCPERLKRITFSSPDSFPFITSFIAEATAWVGSGPGIIPSTRAVEFARVGSGSESTCHLTGRMRV